MRKILRNSTPKKSSKKRWKKYEKTFKKLSKNEVKMKKKPSKNLCEKKNDFLSQNPGTTTERLLQQTPQNQQETYKPSTQTQQ